MKIEDGPPYVHPKDRDWIAKHWKRASPLDHDPIPNWWTYFRSDWFGQRESGLHLSLLPVPYIGNLERAQMIVCLTNPGLADADYYAESQPDFRSAVEKNLMQKPAMDFPLFCLNPEFAWSPAYHWWQKLLRPIVEHFSESFRNHFETLKFLSHNIAALQLFPYHSRDISKKFRGGVIERIYCQAWKRCTAISLS